MKITRIFRKSREQNKPHDNLGMGLVKQYSLIVPKKDLRHWTSLGWVASRKFRGFNYAPKSSETVILGRPKTLKETDLNLLRGRKIIDYHSIFGSYGMGGPGFLGLTLEGLDEILVYAAWGAAEYALMDDRVLECSPKYYESIHPWISMFANPEIPQWDDFRSIVLQSQIMQVDLQVDALRITLSSGKELHQLELLKNDPRLPPMGSGASRKDAYESGEIGDHLLFQYKDAVLWV